MSRQHFTVIGMTDDRSVWFPPEVVSVIAAGRVFSGGKRHHEIVAPLLPEGAVWIDITVPLEAVFQQYAGLPEVVVRILRCLTGLQEKSKLTEDL